MATPTSVQMPNTYDVPKISFSEWPSTQDHEPLTSGYNKMYDELETWITWLLSQDYESSIPCCQKNCDYFKNKRST